MFVKQTLLRFAILWGLCAAATLFLLRPAGGLPAFLEYSLVMAFFFYAFSWVKEPLKWLVAFTGKYGFLSLLFRSAVGVILMLVLLFLGLNILILAGIGMGIARLVFNLCYAASLDAKGVLPQDDDTLHLP